MHTLKKLYCRCFQISFRAALPLMPYREPKLIDGFSGVPKVLRKHNITRLLLVTDPGVYSLGLTTPLEQILKKAGITCIVYKDTVANPTSANVEDAKNLYLKKHCQALLAFGGGSSMDTAKAIGIIIANPSFADVVSLEGVAPTAHKAVPIIAVPTTAGTGSEATIAAVVTGEEHRKYAVSDLCLIPCYAVLDPTLTLSLPPAVTAQTGMDALTHAVEAHLSLYYNTRETRALAESAVRDIFRYLPVACRDGQSLTARERMLRASFDAGCAFTRASVGNVHAIAHTLGGLYGIPHGLACAVTLPVVLEDYGAAVHPHLARLGSLIGLTGTERERAVGFLAAIRALNASLGIPDRFDGIRGEDLPRMAAWAAAETNPVYPVPVVYDQARFRRVLERLRA